MISRVNLTLFAHLATLPDAEIDLPQAALVIAESEYPDLDIPRYLAVLEDLGATARRRVQGASEDEPEGGAIAQVAQWLYGQAGFHGNNEDYYDPKNSFLNEVIDRRTGIPITLAVVLLDVCRRAGIAAHGVSFPGHFLVRTEDPDETAVFLDPFDGRILSRADLRALHARATGQLADPDPRLLEPASRRHTLLRLLNNLRGIYAARSDRVRLLGILERMLVLAPSDDLSREIERLGGSRPFRSGGHDLN
jgi:regulator of sirC expression with transglutaminase-like and TPR domain